LAGLVVGLGVAAFVRLADNSGGTGVSNRRFGPITIGDDRNLAYEVSERMPDLSGAATVYRLGDPSAARLSKLDTAFRVGRGGGAIQVSREPGARWVYTQPNQCPLVPGLSTTAPVCLRDPTMIRQESLPSEDAARRFVTALLSRAGLDVKGADFSFIPEKTALLVEVAPRLHNKPTTGMSWFVAVDDQLIAQQASGWLASLQSIGRFPLIGVQEALRRSARDSGPATAVKAPLVVTGVELVYEMREPRVVLSYRVHFDNGPDLTLLALDQ
jgi:hypothetical protein